MAAAPLTAGPRSRRPVRHNGETNGERGPGLSVGAYATRTEPAPVPPAAPPSGSGAPSPPAHDARASAGPPWSRRRCLALVVALGTLYALGAQLPFWLVSTPAEGAAFFPPAGLTFAVLVLTPRFLWPWCLAAVASAELLVDLAHGQAVGMALGFALANAVEPLVGASAFRALASDGSRTAGRELAQVASAGMVAGPAVGAALAATVVSVAGTDAAWLEIAWRWALGDALGVLAVGMPLLVWQRRTPFDAPVVAGRLLLTSAVAVAVTVVPALVWEYPLFYLVLLVLVVPARVGDRLTVAVATLGVAFAAQWVVSTGRADELVVPGSTTDRLAYVQLFLVVAPLAALALAAAVVERRRTEHDLAVTRSERDRAEAAAAAAAESERRHIARELHDVVGHTMNAALLHVGAARRALPGDPVRSRQLLEDIEDRTRRAMGELDAALGLLDDGTPSSGVNQGLAAVPELVVLLQRAGVDVHLASEGEPRPTATLVGRSAYRIIQESLTNAARHAPGARVDVTVHHDDLGVEVSVVNGPPSSAPPPGGDRLGRGLAGMRERVAVLGGWIEAGPRPDGGFSVRARLPRGAW